MVQGTECAIYECFQPWFSSKYWSLCSCLACISWSDITFHEYWWSILHFVVWVDGSLSRWWLGNVIAWWGRRGRWRKGRRKGWGGRSITHRLLHSYCALAFTSLSYLALSYLNSPHLIPSHRIIPSSDDFSSSFPLLTLFLLLRLLDESAGVESSSF